MEQMTNMEWIAAGNTGCTFATLFARNPESVGWVHCEDHENAFTSGINGWGGKKPVLVHSIEFPSDWNKKMVREWILGRKSFYEVEVDEECIGLRINMSNVAVHDQEINKGKHTSWVQYFGPDSHVVTRQTPNPMLMYTRKLNPLGFVKQVGWNGILHLAHAFGEQMTEKIANVLWKRSYEQVKKKIGHTPTIKEAAKTTWLKKDVL